MWIKKFHKDDTEDSRSPIPTQVVSNEEYLPRPQTTDQKRVEAIIHDMAEKYGKKVGLSRRDFLKTTNVTVFIKFWFVYQRMNRRHRTIHFNVLIVFV